MIYKYTLFIYTTVPSFRGIFLLKRTTKIKSLDKIKVYPNPATDIWHIEGLPIDATLGLYDMMGKKVCAINNTNGDVPARHLLSGNYLLKIDIENKTSQCIKTIK